MESGCSPDVSRWYVLETKPKQETRAECNLRGWGVETLAPRIRESRRRRGSREIAYRITPLFPGYIFARFNDVDLAAKVRLTRGVRRIVGFGEHATPVDEEVIALVRGRIRGDGFVQIAEPRPGDLIRVAEGPFRSLVGVFERESDGRDRVMVLLTTVRCQARIHIAKAFIRRTSTASVA